ncbi:MAG: hypothetical protein QNJ19_17305 [Woeseiaceae bacterium]|nr:hypothetical protein [Woeseiaceae bacterium]
MERHLTLVSRQAVIRPTKRQETRYHIDISGYSSEHPLIVVTDKVWCRTILQWQGSIARRLLQSDALPLALMNDGQHDCDKPLMQRLAMAGAAATSVLSDGRQTSIDSRNGVGPEPAGAGGETPARKRAALHGCVVGLLEEFPKQHLAEEDVVCLMQFRLPCVSDTQVRSALDDLCEWNRVQRITVPGGSVHYDLDTRPHLHVYDARTRELRDAPGSGVIRVS